MEFILKALRYACKWMMECLMFVTENIYAMKAKALVAHVQFV